MDTLDDHSDSALLLLAMVVVVIVCSASDMPYNYPYRLPIRIPPGNFEFDELDNEYCRRLMRFTKEEIRTRVTALKIDQAVYDSILIQKQHFPPPYAPFLT